MLRNLMLINRARRDPDGRFYAEAAGDSDNAMTLFVNQAGGVTLAVSEIHPQDSFNVTIECTLALSVEQAFELLNFLKRSLSGDGL